MTTLKLKVRKSLKAVISLLVMCSSQTAWAERPGALVGDWVMTQRYCRSGAPVRDNFIPGRDRLEISFGARNYTLVNRVNNCQLWNAGRYELRQDEQFREKILLMRVETSQSNCGMGNPIGATYSYRIEFDSRSVFTLIMGPLNSGGPCPAGDYYENSFERFR